MTISKIPIGVSRERLQVYLEEADSGDLNSSAFNVTTSFNTRWQLLKVLLNFSAVCTSTLTITFISRRGSAYNTKVVDLDLSTISNVTSIVVEGEEKKDIFQKGDELNINITQGTGQPTVNMTLIGLEIP